ncbi:TOPRIM nucleotidyl transferase/hydrolase domain-containing protein [Moritella viscosa]|uniref:TOPRIM nucleotidyl transferase/hydrolase domain-containing protein n=1 Tax=Moritella viscosa TaxID=80854 RepID=UPI00349E6D02
MALSALATSHNNAAIDKLNSLVSMAPIEGASSVSCLNKFCNALNIKCFALIDNDK